MFSLVSVGLKPGLAQLEGFWVGLYLGVGGGLLNWYRKRFNELIRITLETNFMLLTQFITLKQDLKLYNNNITQARFRRQSFHEPNLIP